MRRIIVVSLALSATVSVVPVRAEIGPKSPTVHHFEPRRVLPPKAGQTRFLTIQINPEEQAAALAAQAAKPCAPLTATPPPAPGAGTGRPADGGAASYAWFWNVVSPTLADRAGRFQQAIDALSMGPGGQAEGLGEL